MSMDRYSKFFEIDTAYFPTVNAQAMAKDPDLWKKFYPHESFVKLLKSTIKALGRECISTNSNDGLNIWVQGAYGTGKSHAVLTLKKLLEASPEDTKAYFERNCDLLTQDLLKQFQQVKQSGRILIVHKYGSSGIRSDHELVCMIQESIIEAMQEAGIQNFGTGSMRDSILNWLQEEDNRDYFNKLIKKKYFGLFGGDQVSDVIKKLESYQGDALVSLIQKIADVGSQARIRPFTMDIDELKKWIEDVIHQHQLKAIFFIWDEFSEYLNNNKHSLTGFQSLIELNNKVPFDMMVVAHMGEHIHLDKDMRKKIFDRFQKPIVEILLPEYMAFELMHKAMTHTSNPKNLKEWKACEDDLYHMTDRSRAMLVRKYPDLKSDTLKGIMPMQPYAAIFLKNIANVFESNQRSMFDFIKNQNNMDFHGFQWFIENYGPYDDDPLFMLDMLWDYFYEKNKSSMSEKLRSVLGYFDTASWNHRLNEEEQRVLKTILLLQAVFEATNTDLFEPTEQNLEMAFEGSETFKNGRAIQLAKDLENKKIIYKRQTRNSVMYNAMVRMASDGALEELKEKIRRRGTHELVAGIDNVLGLQGGLKLRCRLDKLTDNRFSEGMKKLQMPASGLDTRIDVGVTFVKNEEEADSLRQKLRTCDTFGNSIIVDTSATPFGADLFEQYVEHLANCDYYKNKNKSQSDQYGGYANELIASWVKRIQAGGFILYSSEHSDGIRVTSLDQVRAEILSIMKRRYPLALDVNIKASDTIWSAQYYKQGCQCAIERKIKGMFQSTAAAMKLENQLGNIWKTNHYWADDVVAETDAGRTIVEIKHKVEAFIQESFKSKGRVSVDAIYEELEKPPVALLPCGVSAFVMGFLLSEYASQDYTWTNEMNNAGMSVEKLVDIIEGVFKQKTVRYNKAKTYYIVKDKEEIRQFNQRSVIMFGLTEGTCDSVQKVRDAIRDKMRKMDFPLWILKSILPTSNLRTSTSNVSEMIDLYVKFLNNVDDKESENDIAIQIGKIAMSNPHCTSDLEKILKSKANYKNGMLEYLKNYRQGCLIELAQQIDDKNNEYLNRLKTKCDVKEANWVWHQEMLNDKIDEVICEYEIMKASKQFVTVTPKLGAVLSEWKTKCDALKLPYGVVSVYVDDVLKAFLEILNNIHASSSDELEKQDCAKLLEVLQQHASDVVSFFDLRSQYQYFKQQFANDLKALDDDEKQMMFDRCETDVWNLTASIYIQRTRDKIAQYVRESERGRLMDLWKARTGTDSPKDWSERYMMPILCMFDGESQRKAEDMFDILNSGTMDEDKLSRAESYLEAADFYDHLANQHAREEAFKRIIIREYDVLCDDIDDVRERLEQTGESPYSWCHSPRVRREIEQYAKEKYASKGCEEAIAQIDSMALEEVKGYLKNLIRDNMSVGIEIIRSHKGE